jgi:hypothetical protein
MTTNDEDFDDIEVSEPMRGVPLPRAGGFLGRLRPKLEQLTVGMVLELKNVTAKQEKYLRQKLPEVGRSMDMRYSIRVATNYRAPAAGKRTLHVHRVE